MKPLTIYKASAGSGKTFRLATEYIKMLIMNPQGFRGILAVTFTNKATEEMKMRILGQLYGIWKQLPDSEGYMDKVTQELHISREIASKQAGMALRLLIHNYNYFHVETIDAFFQTVLRNLARELDLTANLRIELNDRQVEEQAVDNLLDSLSETSIMLRWIINYIESNIDDNKSWNVIGQIKSFGRTIFREYYKKASYELEKCSSEKDFYTNYISCLRAIKSKAKKRMEAYADLFEQETILAGLTTDSYAGKNRGIGNYFRKLKSDDFSDANCLNTSVAKCLEKAENWASKSSSVRSIIIDLAERKLVNLLRSAENVRSRQWRLYMSADVTLRHLDKLRLLDSIEKKVRELNEDANRFLLSDTQYLLYTLIKDSDSPFIFEKIGGRLDHVMIDEFQDTSRIQWQNFKVLLNECMSHACDLEGVSSNLIVGDVKQSIYRWRSGDWRLLNNIRTEFQNPNKNLEIRSLNINFRSERNIVNFNNAFFVAAVNIEKETEKKINEKGSKELESAYSDVCQEVNNNKKSEGYVSITLFDADGYDESMLDSVIGTVDKLYEAGVQLGDIAILIRYNKHIPLIAGHFMKERPEYKIVSDEAFRLDASIAVNLIMLALRVLANPDDILSKASLVLAYQRKILRSNITESCLVGDKDTDKMLDELLPNSFVSRRLELLRMPLFDMVEKIYSIFNLDKFKSQSAYICAFYDSINSFITDNSGNLESFIKEWDDNICSKTIQSDDDNGIRLISIHKSKGLEFNNVIIPFCDWQLENTRDTTLWCVPSEEPFCQLPIVPINYSKKLLETIYAPDYQNEHLQNCVDNLNLLYVAFTRAEKNLFVFGKKSGARTRSAIFDACLPILADELKGSELKRGENKGDPTVFIYGSLCAATKKETTKTQNVFLKCSERKLVNFESYESVGKFRQSNESRDFIDGDTENDGHQTYIKMGNILHKLFSKIRTAADIEGVIRQLEFAGVIYDEDITAERMRTMLAKRLSDSRVAEWFSPKWTLFNECSILFLDHETGKITERRPDRVITDGKEIKVIDFKFGNKCDDYFEQVRQYMKLLKSMGYDKVSGYLWFVYNNEIIEVKPLIDKA